MSDTIFEERAKASAQRRASVESLRDGVLKMQADISEEMKKLYSEELTAEEHKQLLFELNKLKLIESAFKCDLSQIEACENDKNIFAKRIIKIEDRLDDIEELKKPQFWWSKFVWFSEAMRTIITAGVSIGAYYAFFGGK